MSDVPGQKLREIIEEYGQAVCDDARRCEALLKDLCPEYKREIQVLVAAQKEGIVTELVASRGKIPATMIIGGLSKRLYENVGIAEEFAAWSVETWSAALEATLPREPTKLIIHCPLCGASGRSSANNAGKVVECPKCKGSFGISADGERTTAEVGAPKFWFRTFS